MGSRTQGWSRRGLLTGVVGAAALATVARPRVVWGADVSLKDRMARLYANQLQFDASGDPIVTVGLVAGVTSVVVSCPSGLDLLPSGPSGTRVGLRQRVTLRIAQATPARQRHSVIVEQLPSLAPVEPALSRWRARGHSVSVQELGSLFGVGGQMIDLRQQAITVGAFEHERDATALAQQLRGEHGALGRVHALVERHAEGSILAIDEETGVRVQLDGVVHLEGRGGKPITVHGVTFDKGQGQRGAEDRAYRGLIYAAIGADGRLAVANAVREHDLLAGLVPAEMFASAPAAALQAQAIAARGQLLTKVGTRHLGDPFLLCAHQHCQVYAGVSREHANATAAVKSSRGEVLLRPTDAQAPTGLGSLVDTVYSANSGGHTEDNEHVWPSPRDPQLRGRPDRRLPTSFHAGLDGERVRAFVTQRPEADCATTGDNDSYRWTATVDPRAVAGRAGVPRSLGVLKAVQVDARGTSGRATAVRLRGAGGDHVIHGELAIRRALGDLRSSLFVVEPEADRFGRLVLHGAGHGHGVGMCQHGAMGMARSGSSRAQILTQYYAGSRLQRLW